MVEQIQADVLVAGGGMGGFMAAERARMAGARVALLTALPGASIRMAGFATALGANVEDQPQNLFNDMYIGGGFVNNPRLLSAIVDRIGRETRFLEELGIPFHRQGEAEDAPLARRQAAGVTRPRAVYTMDMVGDQACKLLLERFQSGGSPHVLVLGNGFLLDLDVRDGGVCGGLAYVRSEERWVHVVAPAVVVATGGAGRLYRRTTNFLGSTGMGYAMALEAGAALVDMEFVSFEPTVAVAPERVAEMELPTMAFADGAALLNAQGEPVISTMPPASKDLMSRAIVREVSEGRGTPGGGVYFDMRNMEPEVATSYLQIRRILRALGLPPGEARVEVAPAQHYLVGGIRTDEDATTRVPGLFAVGEVAGGAHGAHRLATCGGTEVIAMGAIAGEAAARHAQGRNINPGTSIPQEMPDLLEGHVDEADTARLAMIRDAMEAGCGVLRDHGQLEQTLSTLGSIREELERVDRMKSFLGRSVLVASAIAMSALMRKESRGDHFRTDFPHRDDLRWFGNLVTTLESDGALDASFERIGTPE